MRNVLIIFLVVFIIFCIFSPFVFIWSINTLFETEIEYTFKTWLAALFITGMLTNASWRSSKK